MHFVLRLILERNRVVVLKHHTTIYELRAGQVNARWDSLPGSLRACAFPTSPVSASVPANSSEDRRLLCCSSTILF